MTVVFKRLSLALILILLALVTLATPAYASNLSASEQRLSNLTVDPIQSVVTGDHPTLTVHLTAQYGKPIPRQPIIVYMNGKRKAAGTTDSRGIAAITLRYKFTAGT